MNSLMELILSRRSTRAFTDRVIEKEKLEQIVEAARHAPSGRNMQLWHFAVIQNKGLLSRLKKATGKALANDAYNMYDPDTALVVAVKRGHPHGPVDAACAMENILLAAHALELGGVWLNQLKDVCDEPAVRPLLTEAGVPEDYVVIATAALGYPAAPPRVREIKEDTVTWNL